MRQFTIFFIMICTFVIGGQTLHAQDDNTQMESQVNTQAGQLTNQLTQQYGLDKEQQGIAFNVVKAALYEIYAADIELANATGDSAAAQRAYNDTLNKIKGKMMHDIKQIMTEQQRKQLDVQVGRGGRGRR